MFKFKTGGAPDNQDACTNQKPTRTPEVPQKPDAEATQLLERYIKSSEEFQRSVYNTGTKTKRR